MRHEDLKAYRLAIELAGQLHTVVREWRYFDQRTIGVQLVRAAHSIGANIAEAYGRWHRPDQRRCLLIARGSLYETQYWLARAVEQDLLEQAIKNKANELGRVLNGLIKAHAKLSP